MDTLDQDLELDDDDSKPAEEEKEKKEESAAPTTVGLKENIKNANAKPEDETEEKTADSTPVEDKEDEVQVEDPSEDVKEADEENNAGETNDLTAKLGGSTKDAEETEPIEEKPKHDYSLLDSLSSFLYEDKDPLPILCGYFLKVMEQLLDKQKPLILEYLLLAQEGRIFTGLLNHIDHHSLATLLIKLIEQQIQPEKKDKWDASDNSDLDIE